MELEMPGFTVNEAEHILGWPRKTAYKLIKDGRLDYYTDSAGQYRIPYGEVYAMLRKQEAKQRNSKRRGRGRPHRY